jgi:hypothetical protein
LNYHRRLFSSSEWAALKVARAFARSGDFYRGYQATRRPLPDIQRFANIHSGRRCFILGGGPSLLAVDPSLLRDEITFAVNGIFLRFDWLGFQPTYFAVEDALVYEDRKADIVRAVTRSHCFFPVQFRDADFLQPNFHFLRFVYDFEERPGWPLFSTDASRLLWVGGTVTYMCLQLAYYMGIREVYLLGLDHKYVKPSHVSTRGNEWTSQGKDPNHFHPDYFGPGKRWHEPRLDRMERAYARARETYAQDRGHIYNATAGSNLDTFARIDLSQLF